MTTTEQHRRRFRHRPDIAFGVVALVAALGGS